MTLIICKERQKILDEVGHILVTGGPGSGKTTIAIKKATERIEYGLLPGQSVLSNLLKVMIGLQKTY